MSGLVMGDSVQEKVLKELSTNLAALMVVENWEDEAGWFDNPTISSQSDTLQVKSPTNSSQRQTILQNIKFNNKRRWNGEIISLKGFDFPML